MKKFLAIALLATVAVAAFAQNPVGAWKGKLSMDTSTMPKAQSPEQQKMMDQMIASIKAMTFTLNMKANKTFSITVPSIMGQPGQNGEGTWSQKGKTVTLVTTKQNGKAPKNSKPQTMTIDSGGKKMVLVAGDGGPKATITFTK